MLKNIIIRALLSEIGDTNDYTNNSYIVLISQIGNSTE